MAPPPNTLARRGMVCIVSGARGAYRGLHLGQLHRLGAELARIVAVRLGQDALLERALEALRHRQQLRLVLHRRLAVLGV